MTDLVHVITGLGTGGAETMLAQVAEGLARRGFAQSVVCLTSGGDNAERLRRAGIPVLELGVTSSLRAGWQAACLARFLAARKPRVVQGWMYHGDLFATLAHRCARLSATRLLWGVRCSNLDFSRYPFRLRAVVRACARLSRLPDVIVANSEAGAKEHVALGYQSKNLVVIENGVDVEQFRPDPATGQAVRIELGIPPTLPLAIHVARVDPMKDHDLVREVAARLPDVAFLLVGAGTERIALPPNARALGRRRDVARLLTAGDVILSTSAFGEGFSNAVAEGMSAGLVPVVTNSGDAFRIAGGFGAVVPPRDAAGFAQALQDIANLDPAALARRKAAARRHVVKTFAIDRAIDRFERLYRS